MNNLQYGRVAPDWAYWNSRRQMLVVITGAATLLTGAGPADAKSNQGKTKTKGKGQGTAAAPWQQPKVGVCHFDKVSKLHACLEVPPPAGMRIRNMVTNCSPRLTAWR